MRPGPVPPPVTCPIGWQPTALSPVRSGSRTLGPGEGAPVPLRVFFPSLGPDLESAPLLEGCGRYPLVVVAHGYSPGDTEPHLRWSRLAAHLARAGYVVVVPFLAGNASGSDPSWSAHPDEATLRAVTSWARTDWVHADVLLTDEATGIVGHGFGALLAARVAHRGSVAAWVGLSGPWQGWAGDDPFPLTLADVPSLLVWGGPADRGAHLPDTTWQAMARPRHRVVFAGGWPWDYLAPADLPASARAGPCPHVADTTTDLVTMFLARYLPPELAPHLADAVPASLEPPAPRLTPEQAAYAGEHPGGHGALAADGACAVVVDSAVERLVANLRSRVVHSVERPCPWVRKMATIHLWVVSARPAGYLWCESCFPARAAG